MKLCKCKLGTYFGIAGLLACAGAIAGRFYGTPRVLGHKASSIFMVGIALMVMGCLAKLCSINDKLKKMAPEKK